MQRPESVEMIPDRGHVVSVVSRERRAPQAPLACTPTTAGLLEFLIGEDKFNAVDGT